MQKTKALTNTNVLLTIMNDCEKQTTAEEREWFYKAIQKFSKAEEQLSILEEEVNEKIDFLKNQMEKLSESFDELINYFDDFAKRYDKKVKQATEPNPIEAKTLDSNKEMKENLFKTTADINEFFNSKEGQETIKKLFNQLFGEFDK